MCVVGALVLFCTMGMTVTGFSVYQSYLVSIGGLSDAQASLLITIRSLFALLAMFVVTFFYERVRLRAGLTVSVLLTMIAFVVFAFARSFPLFAVAAGVAGLSYGLGGMVAISVLITQWFSRYRALALGICAAATGVSAIVLSPLATYLIQVVAAGSSMTLAFLVQAAFCALVALTCAISVRSKSRDSARQEQDNDLAVSRAFTDLDALEMEAADALDEAVEKDEAKLRERLAARRGARAAQTMGTNATSGFAGGAEEAAGEAPGATNSQQTDPTSIRSRRRRLRPLGADHPSPHNPTPYRYLVPAFIAMLLLGCLGNTGYAHLGILFTSEGASADSVAILLMVCGLALVVGKLIYGQTVDRLGGFFSNFIFFALIFVGYLVCCFAAHLGMVGGVVAMLICGFGLPLATVGVSIFAADLASQTSYIRVLQIFQVLYAASSMIFGFMPGAIEDSCGSYVPFYVLAAVLTVACAALIQGNYLLRLRNRKKRARSFIASRRAYAKALAEDNGAE
jgi:MFS family permease